MPPQSADIRVGNMRNDDAGLIAPLARLLFRATLMAGLFLTAGIRRTVNERLGLPQSRHRWVEQERLSVLLPSMQGRLPYRERSQHLPACTGTGQQDGVKLVLGIPCHLSEEP